MRFRSKRIRYLSRIHVGMEHAVLGEVGRQAKERVDQASSAAPLGFGLRPLDICGVEKVVLKGTRAAKAGRDWRTDRATGPFCLRPRCVEPPSFLERRLDAIQRIRGCLAWRRGGLWNVGLCFHQDESTLLRRSEAIPHRPSTGPELGEGPLCQVPDPQATQYFTVSVLAELIDGERRCPIDRVAHVYRARTPQGLIKERWRARYRNLKPSLTASECERCIHGARSIACLGHKDAVTDAVAAPRRGLS